MNLEGQSLRLELRGAYAVELIDVSTYYYGERAEPARAAWAIVKAMVLSFILPQMVPVHPHKDPAIIPAVREYRSRVEIKSQPPQLFSLTPF